MKPGKKDSKNKSVPHKVTEHPELRLWFRMILNAAAAGKRR
jgi:hypothetical protein